MAKTKTKAKAKDAVDQGGYPYSTLTQSLKVGAVVKDHGGRNVPKSLVAEGLAMGQNSSGLWFLITSARVYGIVEGTKELSLTEAGRQYFYATSESAQRLALLTFFACPPKFKTLIDSHDGGGMPSPTMLAASLQKAGISINWSTRAASYFTTAAKEIGAVDEAGFMRYRAAKARAERAMQDPQNQPPQEEPASIADGAERNGAFHPSVSITSPPATVRASVGAPVVIDESREVVLFEGMRVETPKPLTKKLWNKLKLLVEMMEPTDEP